MTDEATCQHCLHFTEAREHVPCQQSKQPKEWRYLRWDCCLCGWGYALGSNE